MLGGCFERGSRADKGLLTSVRAVSPLTVLVKVVTGGAPAVLVRFSLGRALFEPSSVRLEREHARLALRVAAVGEEL